MWPSLLQHTMYVHGMWPSLLQHTMYVHGMWPSLLQHTMYVHESSVPSGNYKLQWPSYGHQKPVNPTTLGLLMAIKSTTLMSLQQVKGHHDIPKLIIMIMSPLFSPLLKSLLSVRYSGRKAKQPESGELCGNITEVGVVEGSPEPTGRRWSFGHPKRSDIAIQYTRWRLFCFYILLFNGFKSFQAKIYQINMYLLLYFIFLNHSVGIHPTATQESHEQHSN